MFLGAVNDEAPESMRDLVQHRGTWYDLEALKRGTECMVLVCDLKLNARNLVWTNELKWEIWAESYGLKIPDFGQIYKNQMAWDQVSREDEVLFSTSYGPYIPWHILQYADLRYRRGRSFIDGCLHPEEQQFKKAYYLNNICLSTWFLWAEIVQGLPPGREHLNIGRIKFHSSMTFIWAYSGYSPLVATHSLIGPSTRQRPLARSFFQYPREHFLLLQEADLHPRMRGLRDIPWDARRDKSPTERDQGSMDNVASILFDSR
jgi:hypothetical protein